MTDLEITKLCAEAMGWKHLGAIGVVLSESEQKSLVNIDKKYPGKLWCLSGANDWWSDPDGGFVCAHCQSIPDPLHDDAQAMALVKKFDLNFEKFPGSQWQVDRWNGNEWTESYFNSDLNRAICKCVAKMKGSS